MIERYGQDEKTERMRDALDANPFSSLLNKYRQQDMTSADVLDALYLDLHELTSLQGLKAELAEKPAYTSVFRYDPYSVMMLGQDGCFSSRMSFGAKNASAHVFQELQGDNIRVLRTDDEALVVIDQPSTVLKPGQPNVETQEPTVLFTSRMFQQKTDIWRKNDRIEEFELGLLISHGETAYNTMPSMDLVSSPMMDRYYDLSYPHVLQARQVK